MPIPTSSIDHMTYMRGEIAFYYQYHSSQVPSTSIGGRLKGGKNLSGKPRIRGTDRLLMVEKVGGYTHQLWFPGTHCLGAFQLIHFPVYRNSLSLQIH